LITGRGLILVLDKLNDLKAHNSTLSKELGEALQRVLDSGWYSLGPEVSGFEEEFARYLGVTGCRGVASGTDALELSLRAVGVSAGDEVVTAANAGMYATTAILAIGARPVFADIDPSSFNLDPVAVASVVGPKTRAVVVTHLYGRVADISPFRQLADQHGFALVEDCAQACGAAFEGGKAGSFGDVSAFSFYPTKNLGALGDGGAVASCHDHVIERVTMLRQYGWESRYRASMPGGRNSRLDEMQAAVLRVKLKYLDQWVGRRQQIAAVYNREITHKGVTLPELLPQHVFHLYVIRVLNREALESYLGQQGIACDVHYPVLDCDQQILSGQDRSGVKLPESKRAVSEVLTLPCYPEMDDDAVCRVADLINRWPG
jgi:dTDP-4-amino-4,6-dideoxygalactose transaminase